ncbi:MAG: leucine-rich repeat protein [Ruminococcus sp.]|nr:leucine-rich repeat protein [Ruminococcus sp.]
MRKQRILSLILLCAVLWLTAAPAVAATRYSDGVYTFEKTEYNNAVITDCALTDSEIIIPDFVLDYPVIGIGDYAFMSNSTVKTVTMPLSVIRIGEYAFANDPDLESVTIPRWCDRIADNAFWNSPNVVISCYTDTAAQAYAEAHEIPYILLDAPVPKTEISTAAVMLEAEAYRYDGTEHFPTVTVSLDDVILNPETDYSLAYTDNQATGTATVTVTGAGNYEGEATAYFAIRNVLGDSDGNGEIEVVDATLIQRRLVDLTVPDPDRIESVGDVDGGGLDITDATFIQRFLVGMEVPYPINEMITEE